MATPLMTQTPNVHKRWVLRPGQPELADSLSRALGINWLIAKILTQRGISSPEEARLFLNPSLRDLANPFLMKDMQVAVLRIESALKAGETITIYGDYDVDGTTSSSLLYLFLKELGARVNVYIPHRVKEGYGLNQNALRQLKKEGSDLIITVDNGISSLSESLVASEIGLDLIIVDHHQVPEKLPVAAAILNPKQSDCGYPYKELAAVGVTFNLALALRSHLRSAGFFTERPEPNLKKYLDLVALGTIADVVPLTGQNRILVKHGLKVLSQSNNLGVCALKTVAGIVGPVGPGQVGFRLGPRINAAGRLHSARLGFELLTTEDPHTAKKLAELLNEANLERQTIEEETLRQAIEKIESEQLPQKYRSLFLFSEDWHIGVVGIVASRLVERYYLPTLVGAIQEDGTIKASARSIAGLDLFSALTDCNTHLKKYGGHRHAAGLALEVNQANAFWDAFDAVVQSTLKEDSFVPAIQVDAEISSEALNAKLVEELAQLEPFGQGNPEPVFRINDLAVHEKRIVGTHHLKLTLKSNDRFLDAIGFRMAEAFENEQKIQANQTTVLDFVFTCGFNEWNGMKRLQLELKDVPRSEK